MSTWTSEEVAEGIERWIHHRLDAAKARGDGIEVEVLYAVHDDATSAFSEGWLPWQEQWLGRDVAPGK